MQSTRTQSTKRHKRAVMRVFVLFALALVSGCNGNFFHADAPKTRMEALTDAFWDYIAEASKLADDTLEMVTKSDFGAEVNAHLAETADVASRYASNLKEKLPLATQGLMVKISAEADVLKKVLSQDLSAVSEKVDLLSDSMKSQIKEKVNRLKQELTAYADSVDADQLRDTLQQHSKVLMNGLMSSISNVERNLDPFAKEMVEQVNQHLMALKENIMPVAQRVQEDFHDGSRKVHRVVAPYAEDLKEKLQHFAVDLREHLEAFVNSN
ncbi:apolipoprotein A-IV-like [Hippocampus zosterae]|uniref:apolipoprotein A-IV-like n=1 Tax=Hippocampus zosterae TaxID=109293 RepID=UPI00223E34E5|nr:apolipoprotein A-IV-like [Hippocampus zosterae]